MRVSLSIVIVIAMLIVGILVVKNLETETLDGVPKTKAVQRARDIAEEAQSTIDKIQKRVDAANRPPTPQDE